MKRICQTARVMVNQRLAEEPNVDIWLTALGNEVWSAWKNGYMSDEDGSEAMAEVEDVSWRLWVQRNLG